LTIDVQTCFCTQNSVWVQNSVPLIYISSLCQH
jgi:hypothetical protein